MVVFFGACAVLSSCLDWVKNHTPPPAAPAASTATRAVIRIGLRGLAVLSFSAVFLVLSAAAATG
ncbi:hypothetical protein D3C72_2455160 [compost metagenome]